MADGIEWNRKQNVQFVHNLVVVVVVVVVNLVNTILLAKLNSRSRSLYAVARPSVVCMSSVTQAVQILGNIYTASGTLAIH